MNGGHKMSKKKKDATKQRNAIQQMHIEQNRKAGAHKDKKKERNKKACRGKPTNHWRQL
tara:strand:+ start:248 stop:424 length:177 start_codon:yes stop_codon:yes gene_type:complete